MKRLALILMVVGCIGHNSWGQQERPSSLYMFDKYVINPAYGGLKGSLFMAANHRSQWGDINGGPTGQSLSAHLPLYIIQGGVGAFVSRESTGAERRIRARLSYNYVKETSLGLFSFGIAGGFTQRSLLGDELRSPDGNYGPGIIDHRDDHLPTVTQSGFAPDIRLGVYYSNGFLEGGVSTYQISSSQITLGDKDYVYALQRGYDAHVFGSYFLNGQFKLVGGAQLASDLVQTQLTFSAHIHYNNNMFGGISFRGYSKISSDAVILFGGIRINEHFQLFYAFDYLVSKLNTVSDNGSHEFTITYNLNKLIRTGLPPKIIYNPRF